MYAVIDIEATGGSYNQEGVIEVAIFRYDGVKIVDQFSSLVYSEKPIQPFVQRLTGITNKMVQRAPKFHELAKRIVEITDGAILVGHNIDFDYRMLRQEFKSLGYTFEAKTLDTLPLCKQLIPDLKSYSLGKLCDELGIAVTDRHRATGDARATLQLLQLLIDKDSDKKIMHQLAEGNPVIQNSNKKQKTKQNITPKLLALLEPLPQDAGVYYLYDENDTLIFIGKSNNIKHRINQYFVGKDKKALKIQALTTRVSFQNTGNELLALLKELHEIKLNKPSLNKGDHKKIFSFGLYLREIEGRKALAIEKLNPRKKAILGFKTFHDAHFFLLNLYQEFGIAEEMEETLHNQKIEKIYNHLRYEKNDFLVINKGRAGTEKSYILVEKGRIVGYGYFKLHHQIKELDKIKKLLIPISETHDMYYMVKQFAQKHPETKHDINIHLK